MEELSRAHEEHVREILQAAPVARDMLPYTQDFDHLKEEFRRRTFRELSDAEFWNVLVTVAKQGGVRGKNRSKSAPSLTDAQKKILLELLPCPIGKRDRLPYGEVFHKYVERFNTVSELGLSRRQVWLAVLSVAK